MCKRYAFLLLAVCVPALIAALAPASASAVAQSPQWTVTAYSAPTNLNPAAGSTGVYRVHVQNTGGAPSNGEMVTVTDVLPAGLGASGEPAAGVDFQTGIPMSCVDLTCTYSGVVAMDDTLELTIPVEVQAGVGSSVTNLVTVSGGGAPEASRETPTAISSTPASFGIAPGSTASVLSSTQAGGHPDLTTTLQFNSLNEGLLIGNPRDGGALLPPGFAGDLADTPKCPIAGFTEEGQGNRSPLHCSLSSVVGSVSLYLSFGPLHDHLVLPLLNLTTNPGEIARFGFNVSTYGIQGTVSLNPSDYRVRAYFQNIPDNILQLDGISLSVWGVPSAASHNLMRGRVCTSPGECEYVNETRGGNDAITLSEAPEGQAVTTPAIPYLTSPTDCTGEPLQTTFEANSWEEPEQQVRVPSDLGPMTGCNLLEFAPAVSASPDTTRADTPAGFTFDESMGQEGLVNPEGLSSADIENTTVTLPEGIVINPGQASGLGACQLSQAGIGVEGPPSCPSDSKVGQVAVETPILRNKLEGNVYVLQSNPPDVKLLVAPEDPPDGIYVKFVGDVHLNEVTGQLTTTFEKTPQLPFSALKFSFSGGAQAALATPTGCGVYTTTNDFTPWSTPFVADAFPSSSFAIEAGPGGSACSSPLPFTPELIAGSTTDQAGGFTAFSMLLRRADGQQRISKLQFKTPPGLLGMISHVALCGEPQAATGDCPAGSQIGHTIVGAGPGPYPLFVPEAGRPPAPIYIGGPYEGAPYSLVIVVPVVVGPFNLGTTVVRGKIEVDPQTSALTITTDALPTILDGVPADLRTIDAVIDRKEFMFNPTNCGRQSFSGTATSVEGTNAPLSSQFQVGSCRSLGFKPTFKASTSAHTSRVDGTSLQVSLTLPDEDGFSSEANVQRVKVSLPKQLPSPLKTLQKACLEKVFAENPASCPVASQVGQVKVSTPVLPGGLTGTAYFVSHGGAKYPELIMVLTGENGVTVQVHGETFISKAGITSATFNTVPDVPFSSFELVLPQREYPAVTANGNLCKGSLIMPTEMVGQNGLVVDQNTKIAVTGCPKIKKATHKRVAHKKKAGAKGKGYGKGKRGNKKG